MLAVLGSPWFFCQKRKKIIYTVLLAFLYENKRFKLAINGLKWEPASLQLFPSSPFMCTWKPCGPFCNPLIRPFTTTGPLGWLWDNSSWPLTPLSPPEISVTFATFARRYPKNGIQPPLEWDPKPNLLSVKVGIKEARATRSMYLEKMKWGLINLLVWHLIVILLVWKIRYNVLCKLLLTFLSCTKQRRDRQRDVWGILIWSSPWWCAKM